MTTLSYLFIGLFGLSALTLLGFAFFSEKPLKTLLLNAVFGLGALALVDLVSRFTGVYLEINQWTAGISGVLGAPAVCGLILLKMWI